jgi:hypothetical protein
MASRPGITERPEAFSGLRTKNPRAHLLARIELVEQANPARGKRLRALFARIAWIVLVAALAREASAAEASCSVVLLGIQSETEVFAAASDKDGGLLVAGHFQGTLATVAGSIVAAPGGSSFALRIGPGGKQRWIRKLKRSGYGAAAVSARGVWAVVGGGEDRCQIDLFDDAGAALSTTELKGKDLLCRAAAFDAAGRLKVAGAFATLTVGKMKLQARGEHDGFLATFDPATRKLAQPVVFGGAGNDLPRGLALQKDGTAIVGGMFAGDVPLADAVLELDGQRFQSRGEFDAGLFAVRRGKLVWSQWWGAGGIDEVQGISLDDGSVVACGSAQRAAELIAGPKHMQGRWDAFAARFSSEGVKSWQVDWKGRDSGNVTALQVAVDGAGMSWVGGGFAGTLTAESASVAAMGKRDAWVSEVDRAGRIVALQSLGGAAGQWAQVIAVAALPSGAVLAGNVTGPGVLCETAVPAGSSAFIARVEPAH